MSTTYTSSFASGPAVDAALNKALTALQPADVGSAALLDVPLNGDAADDQVVRGNDSRLVVTAEVVAALDRAVRISRMTLGGY